MCCESPWICWIINTITSGENLNHSGQTSAVFSSKRKWKVWHVHAHMQAHSATINSVLHHQRKTHFFSQDTLCCSSLLTATHTYTVLEKYMCLVFGCTLLFFFSIFSFLLYFCTLLSSTAFFKGGALQSGNLLGVFWPNLAKIETFEIRSVNRVQTFNHVSLLRSSFIFWRST